MPARSKAQRQLMAIAEHHPEQVSAKNRGVLKMSDRQLHDFAKTKERKLPEHARARQSERSGRPHAPEHTSGNRYGKLLRGR
jgi:hypothetical protein